MIYPRKSIRSRINFYKRNRDHCRTISRISMSIGVIGFVVILLGYVMYTDVSLGLSSTPLDMCYLTFSLGAVTSILGIGLSISFDNDANEYQMRINHIMGRINH